MDYPAKRKKMVEEQLIRRGISDPAVLSAFGKVKRHEFVPPFLKEDAYADRPLPIGEQQTISQPYMAALMTECLNLTGEEKVLEVGTGSGYQTAILSATAGRVYTVERRLSLMERSQKVLERTGCMNVFFKCSDGTVGWEEAAPFDRILITAAAPAIPEPLKAQLVEGGIMVIPVGSRFSQRLLRVLKKKGEFIAGDVTGCVFVPLVGGHGWEEHG